MAWSSVDGNNKEAAISGGNAIVNGTETATQLLPFLAAFASTGQVFVFLLINEIVIEFPVTLNKKRNNNFWHVTCRDPNLEIGTKGELIPRSKLRWEPFNLHSQYYMVFGESTNKSAV